MKALLLGALVYSAIISYAHTADQLVDEANQEYRKGKFVEAIQRYESIVNSGLVSGDLYYNLGNAYYKSGNIGKAILNYERALKWLPNDDDLHHNLQLANLMITDKIEPTPRLFIWDWWDSIRSTLSLTRITWFSYFLYVIVVGCIILAILAQTYVLRKFAVLGGVATLVVLIFCLIIFSDKLKMLDSDTHAIVTSAITTIKNSPDPSSTDAFVLRNGVKVQIIDEVGAWLKIQLADGKVGWMDQKAAEVI